MNIFDLYLDKIIILIKKLNKEGTIELPKSLNGINVDIPPANFDCDISTNVSMVLSKINKKSPIDIANQLINLIEKEDPNIESILVAKPGFINIKFKGDYWNNFIKEVHNNYKNYGVNVKEKKQKFLIEFVSANPTGPLHVGHCRGAILGDVISNILIFNKHNVSKEYYVNDYGNQVINFTKSVYFRAREILYNEKFPLENIDLYPGDYLVDIAKTITEKNKINFTNSGSLEAQISAISDDIAYNNHDIQDGIRAKMFNLNDLIEINFFKDIYKSHKKNIKINNKDILIYQIIRDSIDLMVRDLIKNTKNNLKINKIKSLSDVCQLDKPIVCFSSKFLNIEKEVRFFLRSKMYNNKKVLIKNNQGKKIVSKLFYKIKNKPKKFIATEQLKIDANRAIADFISGMTDRYAINLNKSI
jgi:arginyl-tRNA synthetase